MISDFDLFVTKFVSVPKEMGHLNCNAFVAGIVGGVLDGAGFPARYVLYFLRILTSCCSLRCSVIGSLYVGEVWDASE